MGKLPISREQTIELLNRYNKDKADMNHFLETEAIMRELAERFNENVEYWGMLGLLHDIDWGLTKHDTKQHLTKAPKILREAGFDEEFISIILSHGYGWDCAGLLEKKREGKIEHALACAETVTGLIHAYALIRGKKVSDMNVSGLKKKFRDEMFAAGVNRNIILECEKTGLSLDEFFQLAINAVKKIAKEVDLE